MSGKEFVVRVTFRPNCDLENTRAALVVRRIARLCDTVSHHPAEVEKDPATIPYLREHGLYIRFTTSQPERVLSSIKSSFFVDECLLVDDPDAIQPYRASSQLQRKATSLDEADAASLGSMHDEEENLTDLLARFNEMRQTLRAHVARHQDDRELDSLAFRMERAVDDMRTLVARSRTEPFRSIVPALYELTDSFAERYGVGIDLVVVDNHLEIDRGVLALMEEMAKRLLRVIIRAEAIGPEQRRAAGLPARTAIQLYAESDGSSITCRCEHNGISFDARIIASLAQKRGVLARDPATYSDEQLGRMAFMPGLYEANDDRAGSSFEFRELGASLHRAGGRGSVRNTEYGTVELKLDLPVPFVALDVGLFTVRGQRLAVPASQVSRFEAYDPARVERREEHGGLAVYCGERGTVHALMNADQDDSPLAPEKPTLAMLMEMQGVNGAFIVDSADGYEHVIAHKLPSMLADALPTSVETIGFAELNDGSLRIVLNARSMLQALGKRGYHA